MILEDYIFRNAELFSEKTAVICGDKKLSYRELANSVKLRTNDFSSFKKASVVVFRASQDINFLITYFAIHISGLVAAPLEKDIPAQRFEEIREKLSKFTAPDSTADILYTTGTTGKSKGVIISHKTILANAENLIEGQGFSHDLGFVITGPLNHIGSLSKIYPIIIKGATLIITEGMKDVNTFFNALDLPIKKMATFLVPSAIRILIQFSKEKLLSYAEKIDFIETGAAPISEADMKQLCEILPKSRLYNTYASTETGIISTYNFNDQECIAGCLGKPMKHSKIIITEEGLISCQGDTLMSGYALDEELTAKVLKNNTIYTSDFGLLDEQGRLRLLGRQDDVINTGGFKVAPTEVENVAMSIPEIAECICVSAPHILLGNALKLIYVVKNGENITKKTIALYLKSHLETFKVPVFYEESKAIKRTFNGKIDRKYYKK
ncbi:MAG: acyl--CoA ligase [Bacteroidales bacterium]|nr:acyl--CoA ligase [Bacteroidales bacterium]